MVRLLILLPVVALLFAGSAAIPPVRGQAVPATFSDTFDGTPAAPEPFASPHWTVMVHERDRQTSQAMEPMAAHHGPACSPPLDTHAMTTRPASVFLCNGHLMTAINSPSYGAIYLTPDHLADFSAGPAVIRWDMSTFRSSFRDWVDVWITPPADHLLMPLDNWIPSGYGAPRNAVHVYMATFNKKTTFRAEVIRAGAATVVAAPDWLTYEDWLPAADTPADRASRRDTFEVTLGRTGVRLTMPGYNRTFFDVAFADLGWDTGVVQWGHHSYTPSKDCTPVTPTTCTATTWHWDNVGISPARPVALVKAATGDHALILDGADVPLAGPAPAGATLLFHSQYAPQRVSFDGGATWADAPARWSGADKWPPQHTYAAPIPAGATRVRFQPLAGGAGPWYVRDVTVTGEVAPPPTATPTATATPVTCAALVLVRGTPTAVARPDSFCTDQP